MAYESRFTICPVVNESNYPVISSMQTALKESTAHFVLASVVEYGGPTGSPPKPLDFSWGRSDAKGPLHSPVSDERYVRPLDALSARKSVYEAG